MTQSLYDRDILLWVEDTVSKLKTGNFDNLDIENLIEEVESLGRSEKRELRNRLLVLIEHLLKRIYVDSPHDYRGWENTIFEQRQQIEIELKDSPSLKAIWQESFELLWSLALKRMSKFYPKTQFPDRWVYANDIDSILNVDFWEQVSNKG